MEGIIFWNFIIKIYNIVNMLFRLDFINIFDLVVGDVLLIKIGDILPVDGNFFLF